MKPINIDGLREMYSIDKEGKVFSRYMNRNLSYMPNNIGYIQYFLKKYKNAGRWYKAHQLVMATFGPPQPTKYHEINHIDHNKQNNNIDNLEWVTHKENIQKARNYKTWKSGRAPGFKLSEETKDKMREAKNKPVNVYNEDNALIFKGNSIQHISNELEIYREAIYRHLQRGTYYKGLRFEYLNKEHYNNNRHEDTRKLNEYIRENKEHCI